VPIAVTQMSGGGSRKKSSQRVIAIRNAIGSNPGLIISVPLCPYVHRTLDGESSVEQGRDSRY